jgi:uncharacterized protein
MLDLKSDWTLITGATKGVGYEMAKILAGKGENLVLVSKDEKRLCAVAREMNDISDVVVIPCNLAVSGSAELIYNECERLGLNVVTLINNAGFSLNGNSRNITAEELETMISYYDIALASLCRLFGNRMKARGTGFILNISATVSLPVIPGVKAYLASDLYVKKFSDSLRKEYRDYGIVVTSLVPERKDMSISKLAFRHSDSSLLNNFMKMPVRKVAQLGLDALYKGKRAVLSGFFQKLYYYLVGLFQPGQRKKYVKGSLTSNF